MYFIFPFVWVGESWLALLLIMLLFFTTFIIFIAMFIYSIRSAFKFSKARWGFGFFPPGIFFWKGRSIEEEISELRSYEAWLKSELDRVRKEIEEMERRKQS